METLTHDETALSTRSVRTGVVAVLLSGLLVLPGLLFEWYARTVAIALLVVCVAAAVRLLVGTIVAAPRRNPPAMPPSDSIPAVSLVVTAYNEADVLPETIEACTNVEYPDERLEVVVGYEAASTDETGVIAEAAADADPRVTAVERPGPPGGKASATNHAIAAASGDVVGILDADQRLEPDAVERAVGWLSADAIHCVKGRCLGTNATDSLVALCATVERSIVERIEFVGRDRLGGFTIFTGGQAFFRADALAAVGEFDESVLLEDLDMAYRLQRAGGTVRVDPGIVTRETNPTEFSSWWSQRKRWARGGMQVARRYLGTNLLSGPPSLPARVDFAVTLGVLLTLPLLVLSVPLVFFAGGPGTLLGMPTWWFGGGVFVTPFVVWCATTVLDARGGFRHERLTYAAPILFWPYVAVQAYAIVVSFLDEFVLQRPNRYVTS